MRYALGLALLLLPALAFAQMFEAPTNSIPAAKCEQECVACSRVVDAAGPPNSQGYAGVDRRLQPRCRVLRIPRHTLPSWIVDRCL
jgi:hypothetical protein